MGSTHPRNSTRPGKAHLRILKPKRKPGSPKAAKTTSARDRERLAALRQVLAHLERICSTAIVVAHALREQRVELDEDAACVLRSHVSDPLFEQVMRINRLLKGGAL